MFAGQKIPTATTGYVIYQKKEGAFLRETRRISFHVYKIISICELARAFVYERTADVM